ncbi:MAG: hypothetical protein EBR79_03625 [Proteobacteria bacterium]|nr:hypothetical protein [Pseudomonadota bacterium]NBX85659.1 hypothetical protein [Pseudomonadota bacterium]
MLRLALLALPLLLIACGSTKLPVKPAMTDAQCMGFADAMQTLREGDELPRVVQVLGQPSRTYRTFAPFGRQYDVLEYDTSGVPCAKILLRAPKKIEVTFDAQGKLVGVGRKFFLTLQRATATRIEGVPLDGPTLRTFE